MAQDELENIDRIIEALDRSCYVPPWRKMNLTIEEAAEYSGIGRNKLRELTDDESCDFVLWVGSKRMIKRVQFEEYMRKQYSI
ncbi:excisionase [Galactobacillus timonensis]|uniref:excisionase n=1 Tax=Galactobacillus timonensis TaxID=2041840 RepID=UPI001AEC4144|nr:excisionase [Galactobacillus timonensis]